MKSWGLRSGSPQQLSIIYLLTWTKKLEKTSWIATTLTFLCIDLFVEKTNFFFFLEKHREIKTKKNFKTKLPWVTEGLIKCMKTREKLHLKCRAQPFNSQMSDYYKKYRNKLNTIIIKAKTKYFSDRITKAEGEKRKIYATLNDAIHLQT